MSQVRSGALAGLGWGATAGAISAGALFAGTRDTLDAPGGLLLGVAQAAAVDAAALWLVLTACGAVLALVSVVSRGAARAPDSAHLHSALAIGVIGFAIIAREWASPRPPTVMVWVGSATGGVGAAMLALAALPRVTRTWRWLRNPAPAVVMLVPLSAAGAWAVAYARWGPPAAPWVRAVAAAVGLVGAIVALMLAGRGLRALRRRGDGSRAARRRTGWLRSAMAILPMPALAVWFAADVYETRSRPPVVLITIDALRTDRVGCYGSAAGLTPNVDALAREGIVFEHAFVSAPWTSNSFAAMFLGRYPHECGMAALAPKPPRPTPAKGTRFRNVAWPGPLLAEVLREAGYTTAAEIANPCLHVLWGWSRGFECYRNEHNRPAERALSRPIWAHALLGWRHTSMTGWFVRRPYAVPVDKRIYPRGQEPREQARWVTRGALRWLKGHRSDVPFFLWVHYIDPHHPYLAPDAPPHAVAKLGRDAWKWLHCTGYWMDRGDPEPQVPEHVRAAARTMYDYEVRYADRWVGTLLDYLRSAGIYDQALVMVTADHGDELWDHGGLGHGHTLHDELLRVPLIVKLPGAQERQRVKRQVRLLDLMPTILEVTGVRYRGPLRGRSLLTAFNGGDGERPLFAEGMLHGDEQKCVRTERCKVIYHCSTGRMEVYDLQADPEEQHDVASDEESGVTERKMLEAWMAQAARRAGQPFSEVRLTPELRRRLRSLGYTAD